MKIKRSLVCLVAIVAAVCSSGSAEAQLLYSFEGENDPNGINANVEGFFGTSTAFTITQDTIGATEGTNSMKVFLAKGPGFVGARTATIPAGLTDPAGVDSILFDVTIQPGDEYMGGFSVIGITIFGDDGGSVQEQYLDEEHVDGLAAGTHTFQIDLDVSHNGNSFNEIFHSGAGGATITLFQFLFNQSPGGGPGADDVIVYIDNVRTADAVVIDADFNGDNVVDGLDFLIYQRNMGTGTTQPEGDANGDGMVDDADLAIWEANYGSVVPLAAAIAAVPEPTSVALFGVCAMVLSLGVRRRSR